MPDRKLATYFALFTEIGIIEQLSRAMVEARLPPGMLASHFAVLNHLIRVADGCTPLALARSFQVAKTTMTHTLAGLERAGLVEMRPHPGDRRSKQVWITQAGRSFRDAAIERLAPDLAAIDQNFPEDCAADLVPRLEALRKIMDAMR